MEDEVTNNLNTEIKSERTAIVDDLICQILLKENIRRIPPIMNELKTTGLHIDDSDEDSITQKENLKRLKKVKRKMEMKRLHKAVETKAKPL